MKITEIIEVKQTAGRGGEINRQPEWTVTFRAEGGTFKLARLAQWNKPELHQVQHEADIHHSYFWKHWAEPKDDAAKALVIEIINSERDAVYSKP